MYRCRSVDKVSVALYFKNPSFNFIVTTAPARASVRFDGFMTYLLFIISICFILKGCDDNSWRPQLNINES